MIIFPDSGYAYDIVLVVQSDEMNESSNTTIVVPVSRQSIPESPTSVKFTDNLGNGEEELVADCMHFITMPNDRLCVTFDPVPNEVMSRVDQALAHSIGLAEVK